MDAAFGVRLDVDRRGVESAPHGEVGVLVDDGHPATAVVEASPWVGVFDVPGPDDVGEAVAVHVQEVLQAEACACAKRRASRPEPDIQRESGRCDAHAAHRLNAATRGDAQCWTVYPAP